MATAFSSPNVSEIGEAAGMIWKLLSENGPMDMAKLVKAIGGQRDTVMQAIGWLAREDKLVFEKNGRKHVVSLREQA